MTKDFGITSDWNGGESWDSIDERQLQQEDYADAMLIIQKAVQEGVHRPLTVLEAATIAGFCGIGAGGGK
jgi:hypothetical protein